MARFTGWPSAMGAIRVVRATNRPAGTMARYPAGGAAGFSRDEGRQQRGRKRRQQQQDGEDVEIHARVCPRDSLRQTTCFGGDCQTCEWQVIAAITT